MSDVSAEARPRTPYDGVPLDDGGVEATELEDLDELGPLHSLEADLAELLAVEDVEHLAAAMDPSSVVGVLIYEKHLGRTLRRI